MTLGLILMYLLTVWFSYSDLSMSSSGPEPRGSGPQEHTHQRNSTAKPIVLNRTRKTSQKSKLDRKPAVYRRHYDVSFAVDNRTDYPGNEASSAATVRDDVACRGNSTDERHAFVSVAPQLYVYSVYWDARRNDFDNDDGGVQLRIMTIINTAMASSGTPLYCLFTNTTAATTGEYVPVLASYYEMCENHRGHMGGYILSCKVPPAVYGTDKTTAPCRVRLSPTVNPAHRMAADFKVINTAAVTSQQRDFTVCVAPLYGDIAHAQIIEFIELSRLLGADHVTFYDYELSSSTLALLEYYSSIERVTLLPWKLSAHIDLLVWYHAQLVAVSDCLYRNMALSRYVVFMDLDEYIVPYEFTSWHDMAQALGTNATCAFQVNSVFVDPYFQDRVSEPANSLRTLTNTWRTHVTSRVRTKCIVAPQLVFEAGIHHVSKPVLARYETRRVDYPQALLHHHRLCLSNFNMNCVDMVRDDVLPRRYTSVLQQRYARKLQQFGRYLQTQQANIQPPV